MAARLDSLANPRGHLPARVYWTRRALVIGVPLALLVVLFGLFAGGGGGGGSTPRARLAGAPARTPAAHPRPSGPVAVTTTAPPRTTTTTSTTPTVSPASAPLAAPDGPCAADEITVNPSASHAQAGGKVTIAVQLRTARPACTFAVSPSSLAVKVTSGSSNIWSSQECGGSVPRESVVVRSAKPAVVPVVWNGRRITDGTCGPSNGWAGPGYYHALAAVIGSQPADTQFALSLPSRPVVTKTAQPKPAKKHAPSGGVTGTGSACGGDNAAGTC